MRRIAILLALIVPGAAGLAASDEGVSKALAELSSPLADVRERAMEYLSRAGPDGEAALRGAYPGANFERRALILDAFARGRAREGIDLLVNDLSTADRGVVQAQRRLVAALYARARECAISRIAILGDSGDWMAEEALRALPGPGATPRAALAKALASPDTGREFSARELAAAVADVDDLRGRVAAARGRGDPSADDHCREIERLLLRLDVERALRAVLEAGGFAGSYDGMYAIVGELRRPEGPDPRAVLLAMVRETGLPEAGVRDRREGYPYLESGSADLLDLRERAAACLGEIGDARSAQELLEYYDTIKKQHPDRYDDTRWPVALALATLKERGPLRQLVKEYTEELLAQGVPLGEGDDEEGNRYLYYGTGWINENLATAWAKIGNLERARRHLRASLKDPESSLGRRYNYACLLSRMGRLDESLAALRWAVEKGYALDPGNLTWMKRDRDLSAVRATDGYAKLLLDIAAGRYAIPR